MYHQFGLPLAEVISSPFKGCEARICDFQDTLYHPQQFFVGKSEWNENQPPVIDYYPQHHQLGANGNVPSESSLAGMQRSRRSLNQSKMAQFGDLDHLSDYERHQENPRKFHVHYDYKYQIINYSIPFDIGLMDQGQWRKFHEHTNEMMLVNHGRNIFPQIGYTFKRMNPTMEYILGIKLELRSPNKFFINNGTWFEVKKSGEAVAEQLYTNELFSVPKHGAELMNDGFTFKDLKIFNIGAEKKKGKNSKTGMQEDQLEAARQEDLERARRMLLVVTRCKYTPLLTVYEVDQLGQMLPVQTASFEETTFITCTGYRNKAIRQLKAHDNKYVRGDVKKRCGKPLLSAKSSPPKPSPLNQSTSSVYPILIVDPGLINPDGIPTTTASPSDPNDIRNKVLKNEFIFSSQQYNEWFQEQS